MAFIDSYVVYYTLHTSRLAENERSSLELAEPDVDGGARDGVDLGGKRAGIVRQMGVIRIHGADGTFLLLIADVTQKGRCVGWLFFQTSRSESSVGSKQRTRLGSCWMDGIGVGEGERLIVLVYLRRRVRVQRKIGQK